MRFEDQSTKCPNCKGPLTWLSHVKQWKEGRQVDEFTFRCEPCNREYLFRDDQVTEKRQGRDTVAETIAIHHSELQAALKSRCTHCGGPITNGGSGYALRCEWCHQEYSLNDGRLQPKTAAHPKPKPTMREFYAVQPR
jgi:nitrite reductase/ring-hydroxylating ferredoxin subunit